MLKATGRECVQLGGATVGVNFWRNAVVTAGLCAGMLASPLIAQTVGTTLEAARQAYQVGNYRLAAARLNDLAPSESRLAAGQRLLYWNLCVDVALESGLIDSAEKSARTHLNLLRQAAAGAEEQAALVRLARIAQRQFPAAGQQELSDAATIAGWQQARDWLTQALAIDGGLRQMDAAWEAETRLELARTQQALGQGDAARDAIIGASESASAGLAHLAATPETLDQFLRGVAVIQQSFATGDEPAELRQAELALGLVEKRLQTPGVAAGDRVKLLVAGAACRRQLHDAAGETQLLTDALAAAGDRPDVEPLARADILVRLAELTDMSRNAAQPRQAIRFYNDAAGLYAKVLADARRGQADAAGIKRTISVGEQADCLLQLQLIHVRLEEWDEAIAAAEELLQLRGRSLLSKGDPNYYRAKSAVGSLYAKAARSALARSTDEVRDFSTARVAAIKAQSHLREVVAWWRDYRPLSRADLAATLNYYAEALRYRGDFRQAEELLDEAGPHFAAAYEATAPPLGEFHSNRGAVLAALGLYQPALASYEAAIAVANSRGPDDEDQRARGQLLAFVYLNMAQLFKSQGQYRQAREACAQARQAADEWLESADQVPFQLTDAALAIVEAEMLFRRAGTGGRSLEERQLAEQQLRQARDGFAEAIEATQAIIDGAASDSDPLNIASARHLQALAHFRSHLLLGSGQGDLVRAQRLWEEIAGSLSRGDMRVDILRVRALNSLTAIALRRAAELRAQARPERDTATAGDLLRQSDLQFTRADRWSHEAQQIAEDIPAYPAVRFQALLARAQVLKADAQIQRAAGKRLRSEEQHEQMQQAGQNADASTDAAIDSLRTALTLVEMPRAMTTGAEEQRAAYFAQFSPGFDLLVDLLVERGEWREALEVAEQRRSRTFLDQLRIAGVDLHKTVPDADRRLVDRAQQARDAYYTCLARLVADTAKGADSGTLATDLAALQRELVEADEDVRSASTIYRQLRVTPLGKQTAVENGQADNEWIERQIGGEDVALVYYVGSEKSYVFECSRQHGIRGTPLVVSAGQAERLGLPFRRGAEDAVGDRPLRADDVAKLVSQIAAYVSRPPDDEAPGRGDDLRIVASAKIRPQDLAIITGILVPEPLRERIRATGSPHVLIVPDGALHQLTFEALPTDARGQAYLVDRWPPICYAPSLQIYRQLREQAGSGAEQLVMLSVADPLYREASGAVRQTSAKKLPSLEEEFLHYLGVNGLARLPATKEESTNVQRAFEKLQPQPGDVIALTEESATEAKLKDTLRELAAADRRVRFLHVAAHGLVDQRYNNLFGALALTPPDGPTAEDDGFLTLYEVMTLPLADCDLAVLSACETNCGPENALEAGSTMARAFFCAGARRVVCSHWKVSDKATAALVADFMERVADDLAEGGRVDYAAALQQAKRGLRQQGQAIEPYYWAPFVLIGTPTSVGPEGIGDAQKRVVVTR